MNLSAMEQSCLLTDLHSPIPHVIINLSYEKGDNVEILVLLIAFGASVVGAICGIGGGVIIKPLLDAFGIAGVAEISFLSGCTVLSMSCYSVVKAFGNIATLN